MILVTGGTGLVGSYLLYELASRGEKVKALIRPGKSSKFIESLFDCFECEKEQLYQNITWVDGDVLDNRSLKHAFEGVSSVYHSAGMISFNRGDKQLLHRVNVEGTANVVNASLEYKVKKLVHVSSISAIGKRNGLIDETVEWIPGKRNSAYGTSKYYGEQEVWKGISKGLNAVIVNPSVIIGTGSHEKAMTPFFKNLHKMLPFYTKGVTGYVDVRDVVKAMILLMESNISGERYVLNADNVSQKVLFEYCASYLKVKGPKFYLPKSLLSVASYAESVRAGLTGKLPGLTRENVNSVTGINRYSGEKFSQSFNFQYIPVKESIEHSLKLLKIIYQEQQP